MTTLQQAEVIDAAEFAERRRHVEAATRAAGLDALIAFTATNLLGPSAFLSGYEPHFGPRDVNVVLLVPGGRATFVNYAYWDELPAMPWLDEQIVKPNLPEMARIVAERLPGGETRVGVAGYALFPALFAALISELRPGARLVDAPSLLLDLAVHKSKAEIAILRETARMTDAGVDAFHALASEGADERDVAIAVESAMIRAGADRAAFPPLVFSGPRVETGIGFPQRRRLADREQLNIVVGAAYRGYKMDIGRVTAIGRPSAEHRRVMETAALMLDAMLAAVRAGAPVAALSDAAMRVTTEQDMSEWSYRFGVAGYVGHGIGCWLDEPPHLRTGEPGMLAEGTVLVLEARLGRVGHGGATLTDPVLVTADGCERLSCTEYRTW